MRVRVPHVLIAVWPALASAASVSSCGARTGLPVGPDGDAGQDVFVIGDHNVPMEAEAEAEADAPFDAFKNDVPVIDPCPDAGSTLIYVIGLSNTLYSFQPPSGPFVSVGVIDCPGTSGVANPFSMAVDRQGVAYVIFSNASNGAATGLFRVSTKTAECKPTKYNPASNGNSTFGMGFVANIGDASDGGETLFVAQDEGNVDSNSILATIDTTSFVLTNIGPFNPPVNGAELTGTGGGRLFAFSPATAPTGSFIAQIDPTSASVIGEDPTPGIVQGRGWAFGFWGGDFYTFTTPSQSDAMTVVHQFNPVTKSIVQVASIGDTIVGAGVSTCAPQD
jgi:hypothetical protein